MATNTFIFGYPRQVVISGTTIILKKGRFDEETIVSYVQSGFSLANVTPGTPEAKLITSIGGLQANGDFHMDVADIGTWVTGDRITPMASSTISWYTTAALLKPNLTDEDNVLMWGPSADTNADNESVGWGVTVWFTDTVAERSIFGLLGMYPGCYIRARSNRQLKIFGEVSGNYTSNINVVWKNIKTTSQYFSSVGFIKANTTTTFNDGQIIFERCDFGSCRVFLERNGGTGTAFIFRSCRFRDMETIAARQTNTPPPPLFEACTFVRIGDMGINWPWTGENCFLSECKLLSGMTFNNCYTENSDAVQTGSGNTEDASADTLKLFRDNCNGLALDEHWPVAGSALIGAGAPRPNVKFDFFGKAYDDSVGYAGEHSASVLAATPGDPTLVSAVAGNGQVTLTFTAADAADVIYARYRTSHDGAWAAESGTFKRVGSGTIVITGLTNETAYEFSGYAKSGSLTSAWAPPIIAVPTDGSAAPLVLILNAVAAEINARGLVDLDSNAITATVDYLPPIDPENDRPLNIPKIFVLPCHDAP